MRVNEKAVKRILVVALFGIMLAFLTACGADVDATVRLNRDGSGERVMEVTIPKTEMRLYGKSDLSSIDTVIADGCPGCMEYSYSEDNSSIKAEFTLPFSSLEDYQNKLNSFCSKNVVINGEITSTPFATEIEYSENVSTREIMGWLPKLLVDKKVLNARYQNSVFDKISTKFYFSGKEYDIGSGRISVSDNVYCVIDSIDVYTVPAGGEKFTRIIKVNIAEEEVTKNELAIVDCLEESIPEGGFGEWEEGADSGMRVFSVTMQDMSDKDMEKAMQHFTSSADCTFEAADATVGDGIFFKGCAFRENTDWTNFGCNENKEVHVAYYMDQSCSEGTLNDMKSGAKRSINGVPKERTNYIVYDMGEVQNTSLYADLARYFHFSSIDYTIDAKNRNDICKTIVFHFDNTQSEDIGEICDKIRTLAKTDENAAKIKMDMTQDVLTLTFAGTADDISGMITSITGQEDRSVSYACDKRWIAIFEKSVLIDIMDMEGFVYKDDEGSEYWQIPVKYEAKISGVNKEMISAQPLIEKKGNSFKGKLTTDKRFKVTYRANRINGLAFVWIAVLTLAVASFIAGIYFLVRSVFEKKKEAKEEAVARMVGMGEARELPDEVVPADKAETEAENIVADETEESFAGDNSVTEESSAEEYREAEENVVEEESTSTEENKAAEESASTEENKAAEESTTEEEIIAEEDAPTEENVTAEENVTTEEDTTI